MFFLGRHESQPSESQNEKVGWSADSYDPKKRHVFAQQEYRGERGTEGERVYRAASAEELKMGR